MNFLPSITSSLLLSDAECRKISEATILSSYVGCKAVGLCSTPSHLVPPYFVIRPTVTNSGEQYKQISANANFKSFLGELEKKNNKVYIRSSEKNESLQERGKFRSLISDPIITAITSTIKYLQNNPVAYPSDETQGSTYNLAYIIQQHIGYYAKGHLSNERRMGENPGQWRYEYFVKDKSSHHSDGFIIHKKQSSTINPFCSNQRELLVVLRNIAKFYTDPSANERFHFEWVWDSTRLWIVQKEVEKFTDDGDKPSLIYTPLKPFSSSTKLNIFSTFKYEKNKWAKLNALATFKECRLPVAKYFVLTDQLSIQKIYSGALLPELSNELAILLKQPLVIRTDVCHQGTNTPSFLLPRSDLLQTCQEAETFLLDSAAQLNSFGYQPEDICFIAHHYIPASSSALAYASPKSTNTLVHSAWGMPDGLLYHGYDSHVVDIDNSGAQVVDQNIQYKDDYITVGKCGKWSRRRVEPPWDWQCSIQETEVIEIARHSSQIAAFLKKPVIVMFLLDVPEELHYGSFLPWFYTVSSNDLSSLSNANLIASHKKFIKISEISDLDKIENPSEGFSENFAILLQPNEKILRSITFLNKLSNIAKTNSIEVFLEGSFLSHVYYILKRNNLSVQLFTGYDSKSLNN